MKKIILLIMVLFLCNLVSAAVDLNTDLRIHTSGGIVIVFETPLTVTEAIINASNVTFTNITSTSNLGTPPLNYSFTSAGTYYITLTETGEFQIEVQENTTQSMFLILTLFIPILILVVIGAFIFAIWTGKGAELFEDMDVQKLIIFVLTIGVVITIAIVIIANLPV